MPTFVQLADKKRPSAQPWWALLLRRGDRQGLLHLHGRLSRQFAVNDGRDPHLQREREKSSQGNVFSVAALLHPAVLSAQWLQTAIRLTDRGDVLVSSAGGMQPRDNSFKEKMTVEAKDWPPAFSEKRRITLCTWGAHWYVACKDIAFLEGEKFNTEKAAMALALRFAPAANITVRRNAQTFKDGD